MVNVRVWGRLFCGLAAALSAATVAFAAPDWDLVDLRTELRALSERVDTDMDLRAQPVAILLAPLDWARPTIRTSPRPALPEPDAPAVLRWTNKRVGLAALSQIYGGRDIQDVMLSARAGDVGALEIVSGTATLTQLRKALSFRQISRDLGTGATILRVPLVVARGATLQLGPRDRLDLSQQDGAYILNLGRLEIIGAEVFTTVPPDHDRNHFAPFITTAGTGSVRAIDATFRNLGFGNTEKFAGFSILAHPAMRPSQRSVVDGSLFENLVTFAVNGQPHITVRNSTFYAMRRNPVLVSRTGAMEIEGNLFAGPSPTNAVRVSNGSDRVRIVGNALFKGARAGLLITSGSDNVTVARNLIWRRNGGGVSLNTADCARIEDNLILDDRQKGVEVRSSKDVVVHGNRIIGNRTAGVFVSAQQDDMLTRVTGNIIRENGSGLATASGGRIAILGNDLSNQFPRFLDGDITHHFRDIAGDLRGTHGVVLDPRGVERLADMSPPRCSP